MEIKINAYDLIERSFATSGLPHTNELNITGQAHLPTLAMCPGTPPNLHHCSRLYEHDFKNGLYQKALIAKINLSTHTCHTI